MQQLIAHRWQRSRRASIRPRRHRFGAFARSIAARYKRATATVAPPSRRFLRPTPPVPGERIIERLRTLVYRVTPRFLVRASYRTSAPGLIPRVRRPLETAATSRPELASGPIAKLPAAEPPRRGEIATAPPAFAGAPGTERDSTAREAPLRPRTTIGFQARSQRRLTANSVHRRLERRIDALEVRRLVRRTARVESRELVTTRRVLERAARASRATRQARERDRAAEPGAPAVATPPSRRAGVASAADRALPPHIDMHRLTDQVVRRIDRRYTAWRERTGRV